MRPDRVDSLGILSLSPGVLLSDLFSQGEVSVGLDKDREELQTMAEMAIAESLILLLLSAFLCAETPLLATTGDLHNP